MTIRKSKTTKTLKGPVVNTSVNSPMGKFHKAMKKIISVPKDKLKDK